MHVPLAYPGAMAKVRWAVRCSATSKRTGRQCGAYAMTGGYVCWVHGGATPAVRAAAARRWEFAKMMRRIERRSGPLVAAFMRAEFPADPATVPVNGRELHAGDAVCITGDTATPPDELEARAIAAGLRVTSAVSRKTRLVVAADPDTESTKARRARELGIPLRPEPVFLSLLF